MCSCVSRQAEIGVTLTQDSELTTKMKDGDTDALAAQNQYLKEALETCRTQILELTQQVHWTLGTHGNLVRMLCKRSGH